MITADGKEQEFVACTYVCMADYMRRQGYLHPSYEYTCVHLHKPKRDEDEDAAGLNNKMMLPLEHHRHQRLAGDNSKEMRI